MKNSLNCPGIFNWKGYPLSMIKLEVLDWFQDIILLQLKLYWCHDIHKIINKFNVIIRELLTKLVILSQYSLFYSYCRGKRSLHWFWDNGGKNQQNWCFEKLYMFMFCQQFYLNVALFWFCLDSSYSCMRFALLPNLI